MEHLLTISYILMFMSRFCKECGAKLKGGMFCPNCGIKISNGSENEVSYFDLIMDIVFIEDNNGLRLSKAKILGVLIFAYLFFDAVFNTSRYLMSHFIIFFSIISVIFIAGLFWYGICRGAGYLIRTYVVK